MPPSNNTPPKQLLSQSNTVISYKPPPPLEQQQPSSYAYTKDRVRTLTNDQLEVICREKNLTIGGIKAILVDIILNRLCVGTAPLYSNENGETAGFLR